ncbi:MAG: hypothetical protein MJ252_29005 [archaeon]|nr:hypothetical protein [archaeon]
MESHPGNLMEMKLMILISITNLKDNFQLENYSQFLLRFLMLSPMKTKSFLPLKLITVKTLIPFALLLEIKQDMPQCQKKSSLS